MKKFKGVFKPVLLSLVGSCSGSFSSLVRFIWADLRQRICLWPEEVASFWSQTNSEMVHLCWECDLTSIWPNYKAYSVSLSKMAPVAGCTFACWDEDEWHQQLLAHGQRMNRRLTCTSNKVHCPLDISAARTSSFVYVLAPTPDTFDQSVEWLFSCGIQLVWIYLCVKRNQTKGRTQQVYQLIHWFGPEKTNYRFENALRHTSSGVIPHTEMQLQYSPSICVSPWKKCLAELLSVDQDEEL